MGIIGVGNIATLNVPGYLEHGQCEIVALCGGWQKIKTKIEEASVERFRENAKKGREGFEAVLEMSRKVFGEEKQKVEMQKELRSSKI